MVDLPEVPTLAEGLKHHQAGALGRAQRVYRSILENDPRHADALHLLGVVAHQEGRHSEAVDLIGRAINVQGENPHYYHNRALAFCALEAYPEALHMCERALALDAGLTGIHATRGAALQALGRYEEAVRGYRRLIELDPGSVLGFYNLGTVYKDLGDLEAAADAYQRALALDPDSVELRANLAGIKLEQGAYDDGLALCEGCLQGEPANRLALAYKGVALQGLGDTGSLRALNDFPRLIFEEPLVAPHEALQLNRDLAAHILSHPSLRHEPKLQATRFGKHTGELLVEPKGPMTIFEGLIKDAIRRFVGHVAGFDDHPFVVHLPSEFRLTVWAVVMGNQGFQLPHIHADGYISGVYYVRLPACVDQDTNHQGWIEFGRPPEQFSCPHPPWLKTIRPREGGIVLFPSFFYHRTIPFESDQARISVAFDAVPV